MAAKIFGIGLSRTGTTSLVEALRLLGYSAVHFPETVAAIDAHQAAADSPVAAAFADLDQLYPGSLFILTVREEESWLASCREYWAINQRAFDGVPALTALHQRLYGTERFDLEAFRLAYRRHIAAVRRHFATRPFALLEYDLCSGAGWAPLCDFLGHAVPALPFPRSNHMRGIKAAVAYNRQRT